MKLLRGDGRMFSGTTFQTVDAKGRIVLPARFREQLGDTFIISKGFSNCVQVLSLEEFENLRESIKSLPARNAMALRYNVIATAVEVSPNAQGRVSIPQSLREIASLEKEAAVVGMDNRIEIWNKEKFDVMMVESADALEEALTMLNF
ncbi:MAG: division/cell wall cluster transcriptional repressor MraZ [Ruminococcus sp.]|nr:division/cell wall cluster transcriptional repressor MraZ [Ruminococcus sp.]